MTPTLDQVAILAQGQQRLQFVSLESDAEVRILDISEDQLNEEERKQLRKLVDILPTEVPNCLRLRRNRRHVAGRLRLRNIIISVPPPIEADVFVHFYLYALNGDFEKFLKRSPAPTTPMPGRQADQFMVMLAALLVRFTEAIVSSHVVQAYERREERLRILRGRPVWTSTFGHHPSEGLACRYFRLETDTLLNRLVLAGLNAASEILRVTSWRTAASTQLFMWKTLASTLTPTAQQFEDAQRRLTRLTIHYRPALALSRALTIGYSPPNLFAEHGAPMQTLEFDLPSLFDRFIARLIRPFCATQGLRLEIQGVDRNALLDAEANTYRSVRPDVILLRRNKPVAVIDAKFKPRYLSAMSDGSVLDANRVNSGDIYQLLFYAARLQQRYGTPEKVEGIILAPLLRETRFVLSERKREIFWHSVGVPDPHRLRVLAVPLDAIVRRLAQGDGPIEALNEAPELMQFLEEMSRG